MTSKQIIYGIVALVVLGAIYGAYLYPQADTQQVGGSAAGATFSGAKLAAINFSPATSAASSTSVLNTDASTRYVQDTFVACSSPLGEGFRTIQSATTTVANLGLQGNTNYVASTSATTTSISTTVYNSTSTESTLPGTSRIWPSGTYISFIVSPAGSEACTIGVHYLAS